MTKCIYHVKDLDGRCSGAIVKKNIPDCEMIGMNYGEPFPWDKFEKDDEVIMVDFSLPIEDMIRLNGIARRFLWIDHHKTAIKEYEKNKERIRANGIFTSYTSEEQSACELAWNYFFFDTKLNWETPLAVTYLGRWDVWDHSWDVDVAPFQMGMLSYDTSVESDIWNNVLNTDDGFIDITVEIGKRIQKYVDNMHKWNMKLSFPVEFEGIRFICINNAISGSPQFDSVWDANKYDAVMVYHFQPNKKWAFHLYTSKEGIDLSKIAVKYGGGGHSGACGFQLDKVPF